jgi:hypothetical protein
MPWPSWKTTVCTSSCRRRTDERGRSTPRGVLRPPIHCWTSHLMQRPTSTMTPARTMPPTAQAPSWRMTAGSGIEPPATAATIPLPATAFTMPPQRGRERARTAAKTDTVVTKYRPPQRRGRRRDTVACAVNPLPLLEGDGRGRPSLPDLHDLPKHGRYPTCGGSILDIVLPHGSRNAILVAYLILIYVELIASRRHPVLSQMTNFPESSLVFQSATEFRAHAAGFIGGDRGGGHAGVQGVGEHPRAEFPGVTGSVVVFFRGSAPPLPRKSR